jgi:hypothetical protein
VSYTTQLLGHYVKDLRTSVKDCPTSEPNLHLTKEMDFILLAHTSITRPHSRIFTPPYPKPTTQTNSKDSQNIQSSTFLYIKIYTELFSFYLFDVRQKD